MPLHEATTREIALADPDGRPGRMVYDVYDGQSPMLLLVHGLGGDATVWEHLLASLDDRGAIVVDLPGHGRSKIAPGYRVSIAQFAEVLQQVAAAERASGLVYIGHSLGVPIGRELIQRHPNTLSALVAIDGPVGALPVDLGLRLTNPLWRLPFFHFLLGKFVDAVCGKHLHEDERNRVAALAEQTDRNVFLQLVRTLPAVRSATGPRLTLPTLALVANNFQYANIPISVWQSWVDQVTVKNVPGGHYLMLEQPALLSSAIKEFLADC